LNSLNILESQSSHRVLVKRNVVGLSLIVAIFFLLCSVLWGMSEKLIIEKSGPKPNWAIELQYHDTEGQYYFIGLGEDAILGRSIEKAKSNAFNQLLQFLDYRLESQYLLLRQGDVILITENIKGFSAPASLDGIKEQSVYWEKLKNDSLSQQYYAYVLLPLSKAKFNAVKKEWHDEYLDIKSDLDKLRIDNSYYSFKELIELKDRLEHLPYEYQNNEDGLLKKINNKLNDLRSMKIQLEITDLAVDQKNQLISLFNQFFKFDQYYLSSSNKSTFVIDVTLKTSDIKESIYDELKDLSHVLTVVTISLSADNKIINESVFEAHGFGIDRNAAIRESIQKMEKKINETFSPYLI